MVVKLLRHRVLSHGVTRTTTTASLAFIDASVPPVLDGIIAASWNPSSNFGPAFAQLLNQLLDQPTFGFSDRIAVESGLQILVIAFSALLWRPAIHHLRDADPVLGAKLTDQGEKMGVLLRSPRTTPRCSHFVDFAGWEYSSVIDKIIDPWRKKSLSVCSHDAIVWYQKTATGVFKTSALNYNKKRITLRPFGLSDR
jgi:hypothetical protein